MIILLGVIAIIGWVLWFSSEHRVMERDVEINRLCVYREICVILENEGIIDLKKAREFEKRNGGKPS